MLLRRSIRTISLQEDENIFSSLAVSTKEVESNFKEIREVRDLAVKGLVKAEEST